MTDESDLDMQQTNMAAALLPLSFYQCIACRYAIGRGGTFVIVEYPIDPQPPSLHCLMIPLFAHLLIFPGLKPWFGVENRGTVAIFRLKAVQGRNCNRSSGRDCGE